MGVTLLLAFFTLLCSKHTNPIGWHWKHCRTYGKGSLFVVDFVLMPCYLASIWCILLLHSTMHSLCWVLISLGSIQFSPQCWYIPHAASSTSHPLVGGRSLRSQRRQSTLFQRYSIGFMSGDCEFHGNIVIPWSLNYLIVDLLVCLGLLSCWNTHSSFLFPKLHCILRLSYNMFS